MHDQPLDLPSGVIRRLIDHLGDQAHEWLHGAPDRLAGVAARWRVNVSGYHDAGWTSVVAAGRDSVGRPVIIKLLPETERFRQERATLEHWAGAGVCRLLAADEDAQALLIESVTEIPGGAMRPPDHVERVAAAIHRLHQQLVRADIGCPVPLLTDYYLNEVVSRISQRAVHWGKVVGPAQVDCALALCRDLCAGKRPLAMLHADLYSENVLFNEQGDPVFIDPHPKIGSAAFDWAFWCVYYVPTAGFEERVELCRHHTPCDMDEVLAWVLTLAVDGALYYLDTKDATADAMLAVLDSPVLVSLLRTG
ncbi:MAG TPA: aminoglycoside phosphotransferase family protein [Pseudonocardiaceae bacterium]|nr:aminoglycoside phosphotransferase family protein [Pseudonocardiaceae bacterium]